MAGRWSQSGLQFGTLSAALLFMCCRTFTLSQRETTDFETTLLRQREESEEDKDFPTAVLYTDPPFIDSETL